MGTIEADGRRGADAGAAGRVDCVDIRNDERQRGKLDSAFLLQHGKRMLERFNNLSKGQGVLVFVAVADVVVQPEGLLRK